MKIGIIGAVQAEVELLIAEITRTQATDNQAVAISTAANLTFYQGLLNSAEVVVVCGGVGKVNAALCAQILISVFGVTSIINTGTAGGLGTNLAVLDIVASTDLVQHDVDASAFGYKKGQVPGLSSPFYLADKGMRTMALKAFAQLDVFTQGELLLENTQGVNGEGNAFSDTFRINPKIVEGRIASGDQFVSSPEARTFISEAFKATCVEMEGAAIAQVCQINAIPFLILRSISDLAGEQAHMSYDDFAIKAAHISSHLVMAMLKEMGRL